MSRNQRLGLVAAALAVAVVAFVIASPGGGDDGPGEPEPAARTAPAQTGTAPAVTEEQPPPEPDVERIRIKGGRVAGGAPTITVERGERVRIVVVADAPDELHLHGYDITRDAAPGRPARFDFEATLEGSFEIESHAAEHAGRDPRVAQLVVEPS